MTAPNSQQNGALMNTVTVHPSIDNGLLKSSETFAGGVLVCLCTESPVKVKVNSQIAHNHACGCTKCWKPAGAKFSVVAVVSTDKIEVLENDDKLVVVDPSALIQRKACKSCGVHLYGPVEKQAHPFTGLSFIHPERFSTPGAPAPSFAAFVSSIIEGGGAKPDEMAGVRARLDELGLPPYDCLSPALMDYIATFVAQANGVLAKS